MKRRINLAESGGWFLKSNLCHICPAKYHTFTIASAASTNQVPGNPIEEYEIHELCRYCYGTGLKPLPFPVGISCLIR